jgi:hypothetical protein
MGLVFFLIGVMDVSQPLTGIGICIGICISLILDALSSGSLSKGNTNLPSTLVADCGQG